MTQKYIELNLNDEKSGKIAEVLSNKTAKKILSLLAEEELSQGDIAKRLNLAANTVDYNIKKLVDASLIEKSSAFFWSVKGKKIPTYRLANKKIIISTKSSFKGLLGSVIVGGVILGAMKLIFNYRIINAQINFAETAPSLASATSKSTDVAQTFIKTTNYSDGVSIWIVIGLFLGSFAFILYRKFKQLKGGKNKI